MNVVRFWDGSRFAVGLAQEGRKVVRLVTLTDSGVTMRTVPMTESREFTPLCLRGGAYPVHRACRKMLDSGRRLGITKRARVVLRAGLEEPGI